MTLNRWCLVLASTISLVACTDSEAPLQVDHLNARWAGSAWVGAASASIIKGGAEGDRLLLAASGPLPAMPWWKDQGAAWGPNWIVASVVFHGTGVYQLGPGSASYNTTGSLDEGIELYATKVQASGTLVVTKYEGVGNKIEGTLTFDAEPTSSFRPFGDHPRLEDGRFRATVFLPTLEQ